MQIFIRGLSGRHTALEVRPWDSVLTLKSHVEALEGISAKEQRLTFAGRILFDVHSVESCGISSGSTINLFLPLLGGKGGFGSNLRAAGKQKTVDNFDACRDLQGRRIRHTTAAAKLEEWQAEAQERELEKVALKHLKELEKEERKQEQVEVDVTAVRKASKETLAGVQDAVKFALKQGNGKSNVAGTSVLHTKRRKMDPFLDENSSDDSSSSDDEGNVEPVEAGNNGSGSKVVVGTKRAVVSKS